MNVRFAWVHGIVMERSNLKNVAIVSIQRFVNFIKIIEFKILFLDPEFRWHITIFVHDKSQKSSLKRLLGRF